jgi:Zn-dependent peptidase ImmA (M78 family)
VAVRVDVRPDLLAWALVRADLPEEQAVERFPGFRKWLSGEAKPTLKQLERFANFAHAPLGYFFLPEPPREEVPIPDFRTMGSGRILSPSPDLLETIYACQQRQEWYREYLMGHGALRPPFGAANDQLRDAGDVAAEIRAMIRYEVADRQGLSSWEEARRYLIDAIEGIGVLVMVSGIVGSNTHRRLRTSEFRGFALADPLAPLIFVNGTDTKAAQIFTLLHELAHLWAGESGVSDADFLQAEAMVSEARANEVAAEVLLPMESLVDSYLGSAETPELQRLAEQFRVSTLVVLRRLFDGRMLGWSEYRLRYEEEYDRLMAILEARATGSGGGNYYATQPLRVSRPFARAVISDALEGRTLYRDAYAMLGTSKHETFERMATELGVA